jgi:hypothetical protein
MKIYVGQTKLTITLNMGSTLTGVDSAVIKYLKPNKLQGELEATISGQSVIHVVDTNFLTVAGDWKFWAEITWLDSTVASSEAVLVKVYNPGT